MELLEDKKEVILKIIAVLFIWLFLVQIGLMLYEYYNYNGFNLLLEFNPVECKFIICKGDTTSWFHSPLKINYGIYGIIAAVTTSLIGYEFAIKKSKTTLALFVLWATMLLINIFSIIILRTHGYSLSLMIFQEMYITLQFLNTNNMLVKSILGAIFIIFIIVHIIYCYKFFLSIKEERIKR